MNIVGIGVVCTRGRGISSLEKALQEGWVAPSQKKHTLLSDNTLPVYSVEQEYINDKDILRKIRRADKFCKMATIAAWDSVIDSGINIEEIKDTVGIIVSSAFGPHATTFRFLDDILDYGDKNVSPTLFSHSVHNAAASYISSLLGTHGPTITISQFIFSFHQALILADIWIKEGRCKYVIVGNVDECGSTMEYISNRKLNIASDGKISPFQFSENAVSIPGEGSSFFLVTNEKTTKKYCEIGDISINKNDILKSIPNMYIFDTDGIVINETAYKSILDSKILISGYAPIFGSIMTVSGFNCAAGALMLKNQITYAAPVQDNPHNINICAFTKTSDIKEIQCIRFNCEKEKAVIQLKI